jgi:hypothetical protein
MRTRDKVKRLARILCNAAQSDPPPRANDIEEMQRLAMYLDDMDMVVLREAFRLQKSLVAEGGQMPTLHQAVASWRAGDWRNLGLTDEEIDGSCGKLQSLAVLLRLQQPNNLNAHAAVSNAYLLLQQGLRFVISARDTSEGLEGCTPSEN